MSRFPSEDHGPGASDYPHVGGCRSCREQRVCNACGSPLDANRCTNGRCGDCHRSYCTSGGDTRPGHGYGQLPGLTKAPAFRDLNEHQSVNFERRAADCTCHFECRADSMSGRWHQHGEEPCPVHPDAPMVDGGAS